MSKRSWIKRLFFGDGYGGQSFLWNPINGITGKNRQQLLYEYRNLVYSCVSTISEDVAKYEPLFFHEGPNDEDQEIPNHPFRMLLNNPNPMMSQYELLESTQSLIELTGECFWYLTLREFSRQPVQIDIMRPDRVEIAIDEKTGDITGYVFKKPDGTEIPLELDEVIHFKMYNPLNRYRGLGTVEAGLLYIETETETSSFQRNFMRNQASPSGVLSFKGNISSDAFNKTKKIWRDQQTGTVNAGKTLFIREADVDFTKIGLSIAELDMTALKNITQDEVRSMFRIPKIMLGEVEGSGLGRDVAETAEYIYQKRTIEPKLVRIDDAIRLYCRVAYKDPVLCVEHESQIPQDQTKLVAEIGQLVDRVYTKDEARALLGLDPIEGGDQLYIPFNMTAIGQPIIEPMAATSTKQYGKLRILTTQPALSAPVEKATRSEQSYFQQLNHINMVTERAYSAIFSYHLQKQKTQVLLRMRNAAKALTEDDLDEVAPQDDDEVVSIVAALSPLLIKAMNEGGKAAIEYIGTPDIEFILDQAVRDRIFSGETRLLKGFNRDTALKIQKQLAMGLQEGETLEQLTHRVETVYSEATGYRAERIARSESNRALVGATKDAYGQAGVIYVRWVTDGDPCPECAALEGTIVDVNDTFLDVGDALDYGDGKTLSIDYADIEGGDLHPNCNCKLVPEFSAERSFPKQLLKVEHVVKTDEGYKELYEEQKEYAEQLELIVGLDGNLNET